MMVLKFEVSPSNSTRKHEGVAGANMNYLTVSLIGLPFWYVVTEFLLNTAGAMLIFHDSSPSFKRCRATQSLLDEACSGRHLRPGIGLGLCLCSLGTLFLLACSIKEKLICSFTERELYPQRCSSFQNSHITQLHPRTFIHITAHHQISSRCLLRPKPMTASCSSFDASRLLTTRP